MQNGPATLRSNTQNEYAWQLLAEARLASQFIEHDSERLLLECDDLENMSRRDRADLPLSVEMTAGVRQLIAECLKDQGYDAPRRRTLITDLYDELGEIERVRNTTLHPGQNAKIKRRLRLATEHYGTPSAYIGPKAGGRVRKMLIALLTDVGLRVDTASNTHSA
jgi:hypothetical protein